MQRLVITGMGAVCALGNDAPSVWNSMTEGRTGIAPITRVAPELLRAGGVVAEVKGFDPTAYFDDAKLSQLDLATQYAMVAADEAVRQSGLAFEGERAARTAVVVGSGVAGEASRDGQYYKLYAENASRLHPLSIVRMMMNAPASQISMAHGITGPAFVVASACASSNHAFAQAAMMIRSGLVDAAVVGGTEACLTLGTLRAWEAMRVLAPDTCRPFSAGRRGIVLGEGAGMFVVETLEQAQARGLSLFWSHDLDKLGAFIESTK